MTNTRSRTAVKKLNLDQDPMEPKLRDTLTFADAEAKERWLKSLRESEQKEQQNTQGATLETQLKEENEFLKERINSLESFFHIRSFHLFNIS